MRTRTSRALLSTLRCWDTADGVMGKAAAISPAERSPKASILMISLRIGSASATNISMAPRYYHSNVYKVLLNYGYDLSMGRGRGFGAGSAKQRLSRHIYTIPARLSGAEQSRIGRWRSASLPTCGCPKELYEATSRVGSRIGSSNATSNCRRIFCPAVPELSGCVATFKKRQESDGSDRPCAVSCSHPEQRVDETFHQPANSHLPGARIGASAFHTCPHSE